MSVQGKRKKKEAKLTRRIVRGARQALRKRVSAVVQRKQRCIYSCVPGNRGKSSISHRIPVNQVTAVSRERLSEKNDYLTFYQERIEKRTASISSSQLNVRSRAPNFFLKQFRGVHPLKEESRIERASQPSGSRGKCIETGTDSDS